MQHFLLKQVSLFIYNLDNEKIGNKKWALTIYHEKMGHFLLSNIEIISTSINKPTCLPARKRQINRGPVKNPTVWPHRSIVKPSWILWCYSSEEDWFMWYQTKCLLDINLIIKSDQNCGNCNRRSIFGLNY